MLKGVPTELLLLVGAFALAIAGAVWAVSAERQRRSLLRRAAGGFEYQLLGVEIRGSRSMLDRLVDWLAARVPVKYGKDTAVTSRLVQAGFDGPNAPAMFALSRIACMVLFPSLALAFAPRDDSTIFAALLVLAVAIGALAPTAVIDNTMGRRQAQLRRGIPDALDLLVVSVESGIALDAAVQRVSRELGLVHPVLAAEFVIMSRRVSAGMSREQAMQALYLRTGVEELRGLASHLIQSERWGTSVASVLRVYAHDLRRKRRIAAEKRAATAATRMLLPLALFIFPTIFIVLLGPAMIQISAAFGTMNK